MDEREKIFRQFGTNSDLLVSNLNMLRHDLTLKVMMALYSFLRIMLTIAQYSIVESSSSISYIDHSLVGVPTKKLHGEIQSKPFDVRLIDNPGSGLSMFINCIPEEANSVPV